MKIEYLICHSVHQCSLCRSWSDKCRYFKIIEQTELHASYRTLETFKCAICHNCFQRGEELIKQEIHKYMKEYIGSNA